MRLGILLFTLLVYGVFKLCRGQLPFDSSGVAQLFAGGENESSENDASLLSNVALGLQKQGKSLADDIKFALRFTDLWKTSTFPTSVASNIDSKCLNDSIIYYYAYILELDWANKMYESTGKQPEGLYGSGNTHAPGLFDECLSVNVDIPYVTSFQGRYCSVFFKAIPVEESELNFTAPSYGKKDAYLPRLNLLSAWQLAEWHYDGPRLKSPMEFNTDLESRYQLSNDFCIPSSCSVEDFRKAVAQLVGQGTVGNATDGEKVIYYSAATYTDENYCYTAKEIEASPQFDGPDITVLVVLSILTAVIIAATSVECWKLYSANKAGESENSKTEGILIQSLLCFSILSNCRKLLSSKASVADNLSCLNGIRVLSTTWIVMYHTYYQALLNTSYNIAMMLDDAKHWWLHGAINATLAVDTFFVMSSLLVTYSLMRELDRNKGRFNVFIFYVHRYLRLTIVYAFILGFIATLLVYVAVGPNWQNVRYLSEACRWNWWNNLLYANNYVRTYPLECMGETWYLACDMQMFVLSPVFIFLIWKWKKVGLAFLAFVVICSIGGQIAIFIVWNLPAMGFFTRLGEGLSNTHYYYGYYVQLWTRWPPYLLGIALGWILHITRNKSVKMSKVTVAACWAGAIATALAVLYGMVAYLDEATVPEINAPVRVSYGVLHRLGWSCAIVWIIFACTRGYGGIVNRFLSWKAFTPLARLTYVIYLTHLTFLTAYHARARKPYYYTGLDHTIHYFGVLLMVSLISFVICLTIEVPFLNLEKLLLRPSGKGKSRQ